MPYIVTTKYIADGIEWQDAETRRAVATLEEARNACIAIIQPHAKAEAAGPPGGPVAGICLSLMRTDWSGGTVGPLPDGTVIEVEQVIWADLADRADCFPVPWSHDRILAAFNARGAER